MVKNIIFVPEKNTILGNLIENDSTKYLTDKIMIENGLLVSKFG